MSKPEEKETKALEVVSSAFVKRVQQLFAAEMGSQLSFTDYEKTLAQHMYIKCDAQLKALEEKRTRQDILPYKWENVNLQKLAMDTVHRIGLGLDALIPNHLHPVPYFNNTLKKHDLDLRIGYTGKDYCRRKMAIETPVEVIYEIVHKTDTFKPIMRTAGNPIEQYDFEINEPFARGEIVGGFGYIIYTEAIKNRLIIVTMDDIKKAERGAKTQDFWADNKYRKEMIYKTIVHRVADKLPLDPQKVNAKSYAYVEAQEVEREAREEIESNANKTTIDIEVESVNENPEPANKVMQDDKTDLAITKPNSPEEAGKADQPRPNF